MKTFFPTGMKTGTKGAVKFKFFRLPPAAFALCSSRGCGAGPFRLKNIAKSDIDLIADARQQELRGLLDSPTVKLQKGNPPELRKAGAATMETGLAQIFPAARGAPRRSPSPSIPPVG